MSRRHRVEARLWRVVAFVAKVVVYSSCFAGDVRTFFWLARRAARHRQWDALRLFATEPLYMLAVVGLCRGGYAPSLSVIFDPDVPRAVAERRLEILHETVRRRADAARALEAAMIGSPRC